MGGLQGVGVEGGGGVIAGAGAEEGLVVVLGQLGQAGDHLLHRQLGGLAGPPPQSAHQPRLLQVILQSGPLHLLDVERWQLGVSRQSPWEQTGSVRDGEVVKFI